MEGVSPGFRGMNTGDFRRRIGDFFRSKTSSVAEQNGRFDDYKDWNHFDVLKTLKREGEARLGEAKIDSAESVLNNIEKRNERDFEFLKKFLTEKDAGGKERKISWKDLELVGDVGYQVDEPEKLPFNKVEKEFPREGDGKRYGILKIIGEGGMGRVALAWDARMMRPVVIKMIKQKIANERTRSNFEKEIKLNALFSNNKYLIRTDSVIRLANGELGIVMEYVKGKDLSDYLKTVEFENIQELDKKTAKIMVEVLLGLRELHDQGVVHRDIKPQNILMDEENGEPGNPRARLIDLGLARILSKGLISKGRGVATQLTSAGRAKLEKMAVSEKTDITGTLPYMAPEELDGRATKSVKSDLYSFGVTFYEFITKEAPFTSEKTDIDKRAQDIYEQKKNLNVKTPDEIMRGKKRFEDLTNADSSALSGIIMNLMQPYARLRIDNAQQVAELVMGAIFSKYPATKDSHLGILIRELCGSTKTREALVNQFEDWQEDQKILEDLLRF